MEHRHKPLDESTVLHLQTPVAQARQMRIVRHEHYGLCQLVPEAEEQAVDFLLRLLAIA